MISIDMSIKLQSIEWLNAGDDAKKVLYLEEKRPGLYATNEHFIEPGKSFRIWVRTDVTDSSDYYFVLKTSG